MLIRRFAVAGSVLSIALAPLTMAKAQPAGDPYTRCADACVAKYMPQDPVTYERCRQDCARDFPPQ
jgi:hypothetical protein